MNDTERLILMNQYAILEFLSRAHPETAQRGHAIYHDPDTYAWYQSVLAHGYETLLSEITQHVYPVDLTQQDQKDVLDTLDMYRHLQNSFEALKDKGELTSKDVDFLGWDGHRSELSFARVFCFREGADSSPDIVDRKPDRYDMIRPSPAYDSHFNTMGVYQRMLAIYRPIFRKMVDSGGFRPLTYDEINSVLDAKTHPDHR